ncbi:lipoprotein [Odoribacter sp. AF15-53]
MKQIFFFILPLVLLAGCDSFTIVGSFGMKSR